MQNKFAKNILVSAIALSFVSTPMLTFAEGPNNVPQAQGSPDSNQAIMNFVGADIESVIKAVGQYTNTTFIIDPRVKGTISLVSEKALTKAQAFDMLAATLRLQGFSLVRGDGFVKVVPEADAKLQVSPTQVRSVKGDQIATRIFTLNYESATNLVPVLRPLISPNNTINANPGNNTLVVTDYADNLNRISKMIATLDTPNITDLDVIPVRYAVASDLATMVTRLLDNGTAGQAAGAAGGDSSRITLMADPRTNSVILRAPTVARANLAKSLIAKLDQPTAQAGNVHVVYLKNADATKLAQTLRSMVSFDTSSPAPTTTSDSGTTSMLGGSGSSNGSSGSSGGSSFGSTSTGTAAAKSPITNTGASSSGGGSKGGFIQADASTNTLIITASEPVYRDLRTVIDQLDMRREQVYIEALIVEVSDTANAGMGVQWLGLSGNSNSSYRVGGGVASGTPASGDNIFTQALGLSTGTGVVTQPSNGLTVGIFRQLAGKLGLGVLAQAFQNDNVGNVLSVPNLITLDNEEAKMIVGQNIPIVTGSYLPSTTGGSTSNPFQTVERQDVGVALRVKPQISQDGTVKMSITQEVSTVDPSSINNTSGVNINKRLVDTNVVVGDGEVLVLGGLMQETTTNYQESVPGLSSIPWIGGLFKSKNNTKTKNNLLIFLRPTIIRDAAANDNVVADRYDYIQAAQARNAPPQSNLLLNTSPGSLPALQRNEDVRHVLDGAFDGTLMNLNPDRKKASDTAATVTTPATAPTPSQPVNNTP
ncbi:type II secretion system secretin GspD [Glaciimonas soli]|nr:type II secretion system secretin GspD [Glaciimonas soli]